MGYPYDFPLVNADETLVGKIVGRKNSTVPQPGFDSKIRVQPLSSLMVKANIDSNRNGTPNYDLMYNPLMWSNANHQPFESQEDWLSPDTVTSITINGRRDTFSQRCVCGPQTCVPGVYERMTG